MRIQHIVKMVQNTFLCNITHPKQLPYKLPSMKALYAEKDRLIELRDSQREDFSNRRDYERELRTVSTNIDMILGKSHEQEQQIENEKYL